MRISNSEEQYFCLYITQWSVSWWVEIQLSCHIIIIIGYYAMDQVPLSLWAAWGIYSEPIRYRSLFPHNEARKQAIAGLSQCPASLFICVWLIVYLLNISTISVLLLTVLFFLPFFQLWVNDKLLLVMGGLYAFLFVPVTVGFVKPNLLEQQSFVSRLKRKLQLRILTNETAHFMQSFAEFWNSGWLQV